MPWYTLAGCCPSRKVWILYRTCVLPASSSQTSQTCWAPGVTQIPLMRHLVLAFSVIHLFFFPMCNFHFVIQLDLSLLPYFLTQSTSVLSLYPAPMVKGPQGTILLMMQRWACSHVYLQKCLHKVLKCELYSQKWWLGSSKRTVYKEWT